MYRRVAGALYVPQVGIINPSEFAPANSIEAVIWVATGGRGTLAGAAIGAIVVNYLKTVFTSGVLAPYWLIALGALFIFVTLALPLGIVGAADRLFGKRGKAGSGLPPPTSGIAVSAAVVSDAHSFGGAVNGTDLHNTASRAQMSLLLAPLRRGRMIGIRAPMNGADTLKSRATCGVMKSRPQPTSSRRATIGKGRRVGADLPSHLSLER